MRKDLLPKTLYKYRHIILLTTLLILSYQVFGVNQILALFDNSLIQIGGMSLYVVLLLFLLRSISILVPIIPGTYCSVIAGYIFGIKSGLLIIALADFLSCSSCFFLARNFGRGTMKNILGEKKIKRIEKISKNHIEHNFFLMTGLLMTQFFDFVCYAVGLTKVSWKKFMPALIFSIFISDAPFVAGGHAISNLNSSSIKDIINGDVKALQGDYLIVFIISAISVFALAILNSFVINKIKLSK